MNRFLTTASCAAILLLSACSSSDILDEITEVAGGPDDGGSGGSDTGGTGSGGTGDTGTGGTGGTGTGDTGTGDTGTGGTGTGGTGTGGTGTGGTGGTGTGGTGTGGTGTGGTGTGTGGTGTALIPMPVFGGANAGTIAPATLQLYETALLDVGNALNTGVISPTVQTSGAATFDGVIGFETGDDAEAIVGNFSMIADFGNATATASATDFARYNVPGGAAVSSATVTQTFSGALGMLDGTITGSTVTGTLAGTVNDGSSDFDADTTLQGIFYDNGANTIFAGTADGTVTEVSSGLVDTLATVIVASD